MVDMRGVFAQTRVAFKARDCNKWRPRVGQEVLRCLVDDESMTATSVELAPFSWKRALLFRVDVRIGIVLAVAVASLWLLLATMQPHWSPLWRWLGCINAVTLCAFLADKWSSALYGGRVPESLLLALTAAGGAAGALSGMFVARHKSNKLLFVVAILCIVAAQSALWVLWQQR